MKYTLNQLTEFSLFFKNISLFNSPLKLENYSDPIELYKKGHKIHIKKLNRGKFTEYCEGNVTDACILRGKNSSDPKIRRRATFAANARTWKKQNGGALISKNGIGGTLKVLRKVFSVSKFPEEAFNFNKNWYFGHATNPLHLPSIMKTGLRGPLMTMPNSTFVVHNPEQLLKIVFNATNNGLGLHHNNRGIIFFEVPKLPNELRAPTDLYERLTLLELELYIPTLSIPPRFNFAALDGTKLF